MTGPPPPPPISRSGSGTVSLFIIAVYIVIRLISVFDRRLAGGNQNEEEELEHERVTVVVYPFTEKFPLDSKWKAAFWVVPAENF